MKIKKINQLKLWGNVVLFGLTFAFFFMILAWQLKWVNSMQKLIWRDYVAKAARVQCQSDIWTIDDSTLEWECIE